VKPTTNMGNPAADYCKAQGGTIAIHTDANGNESGYCHLPDGSVVEEWALFNMATDIAPTPPGAAAATPEPPSRLVGYGLAALAGAAIFFYVRAAKR